MLNRIYNLQFTIYKFSALFVLSFYILHSTFYIPTVYAACNPDTELETDFGCFSKTDPLGFTTKLYEIGLGLIGGVALLAIIFGGFLILSSNGNQNQVSRGKKVITSAFIGLILAVMGYSLYKIVGANVLQVPGFK